MTPLAWTRRHATRLAFAWTALVLCAVSPAALPRTVLDLDSGRQPVSLADWADAWIDGDGTAEAEQVVDRADLRWSEFDQSHPARIPYGGALWLRFMVPAAPDEERWYLEIPSSSLESVILYTRDSMGAWQPAEAGTRQAVDAWPVPSRTALLPIAISAEEPRSYLVRIAGASPFFEPVRFVSERHLTQREQRTSITLGCFLGLQVLIAILMVAKGIALRDRPHVIGAAAVLALTCSQAAATGLASLHLWSSSAWLAAHAVEVLGLACVVALTYSTLSATSAAERWPRLDSIMQVLGVGAAAMGAVLLVYLPEEKNLVFVSVVGSSAAGLLLFLALVARQCGRHGRNLVVGSVALAFSGIPAALHLLGAASAGFWTQHGLQFGTVAFSLATLEALGARSADRQENTRRILGMDRMDPSTGLINRFEFTERLLRLTARSHRLRYRSAIFIVDLTNSDDLVREYGRSTIDEMLLRVSRRLLSTVRDIDTVARVGEHRFALLVEGPLTRAEAQSLGPRLVARCLMPFRGKPEYWIAKVRVAQALLPFGDEPPTVVMERLEDLLAEVPSGTRKAVFTLNHEEEHTEPQSVFAKSA